MDKPHATPTRFDGASTGRPELLRGIVLPAAGAVILVALFFLILLGPSRRAAAPDVPEESAVTAAAAQAPRAAVERARCDVPKATGQVGVVSRRFEGKQTSSGHRYDPEEAVCIANAATPFGDVAYGTELSLARATAPDDVVTCRVVGRWNGERHTERILLVSSRLARILDIGENGLADVRTDCAPTSAETQLARN